MNSQQPAKQQIILDTNIIHYATDGKYSDEMKRIISRLVDKYEFAMSAISIYEVFGGLHGRQDAKKLRERSAFASTLDKIPIEIDHLRLSGALCTMFQHHPHLFSKGGMFKLADTLIGAQAMLNRAHILTANRKDFPFPFYEEVGKHLINPMNERAITLAVLQPSAQAFNLEHGAIYA